MKAKIILNQPLTQDRYGLHFEKGEAYTDNEYLIGKLKSKGVKVEILKDENPDKNPEEKTIDEMTVAELKEYAADKNIEIPSNVKSKADIIEFIKNYKEDDENNGEETEETSDETPDNPDTKPDNTDENPDKNNAEGENNEKPKAE